jgi:hypothetical protein
MTLAEAAALGFALTVLLHQLVLWALVGRTFRSFRAFISL